MNIQFMKSLSAFCVGVMTLFAASSCYDDLELRNEISDLNQGLDDLKTRIETLETKLNSELGKIQRLFQEADAAIDAKIQVASVEKNEDGKKKKTDKAITIETAKALGKALCDGDEYGLLIKIEPSNVLMIMKQAEEMWGTSDINYIYGLMNNLLYELESSSYYSYKPGTLEDGFEHYDMRLQNIRNEIDRRFWNKMELRDKLYRLVEEEEMLIKSYSQPGAPERWMLANPKLRYFDCVFDVMEENPQLYERIKEGAMASGGQVISFNFYPTQQECEERRIYFEELIKKNNSSNIKIHLFYLY